MTYLRYYNWFSDSGMYVYLANEGGLYSISLDNVQVKPNGIVLRYFNRDGLRRRPNL